MKSESIRKMKIDGKYNAIHEERAKKVFTPRKSNEKKRVKRIWMKIKR